MTNPVKRPRAKVALMPVLGFAGDLPVRFGDDMARGRVRALARIVHGKVVAATRAHISDVARWHRLDAKALRSLEERGIAESERGRGDVRFYEPGEQVKIEVALALRELGASAEEILGFLQRLEADRAEARAFLKEFLDQRLAALRERMELVAEARGMVEAGASL